MKTMAGRLILLSLFVSGTIAAHLLPNCPAKPLYQVMLDHCGPEPKINPPIDVPHAVAPPVHQPLQHLPHPPIPAPRVLSHRVVHYKTILRPQVYQRVITVPKVYRFLKKQVAPVIEHIPYTAKPICNEIVQAGAVIPGSAIVPPPAPPAYNLLKKHKPIFSKLRRHPGLPPYFSK